MGRAIIWVVVAMIGWTLSLPACFGQITAKEAGSPAALQDAQKFRDRSKKDRALNSKYMETGKSLFGVDNRWTDVFGGMLRSKNELLYNYSGSLYGKEPQDFAIGDWGCTRAIFTVVSKVSDRECLVRGNRPTAPVMLLRGLDMSKVTDEVQFVVQLPLVIQGTYQYTSVAGAEKTILVLEFDEKKFADASAKVRAAIEERKVAEEKERAAAEDRQFRTWTDDSGEHTTRAKFLRYEKGKVYLTTKEGKDLALSMNRLSKGDQAWVRDELKRRLAEKQPEKPKGKH